MPLSRREVIAYTAVGALTAIGKGAPAYAEGLVPESPLSDQAPLQLASDRPSRPSPTGPDGFDMRDHLSPRRLTMAMWDVAYALRHGPGGSFANYDRVLDEAVERGYNTLRIDPMPCLLYTSRCV